MIIKRDLRTPKRTKKKIVRPIKGNLYAVKGLLHLGLVGKCVKVISDKVVLCNPRTNKLWKYRVKWDLLIPIEELDGYMKKLSKGKYVDYQYTDNTVTNPR